MMKKFSKSFIVYDSSYLKNLLSNKIFNEDFEFNFYTKEHIIEIIENVYNSDSIFVIDSEIQDITKLLPYDYFNTKIIMIVKPASDEEFIELAKKIHIPMIIDNENISMVKLKLEEAYSFNQSLSKKIKQITESVHDEIKSYVEFDAKTGLYTNEAFIKYSEIKLSENPDIEYSIVHIDIDQFKTFNEIYGFKAGDIILDRLGNYMKNNLHKEEIAARTRDDHIMILLNKKHLHVEKVLDLLNRELSKYFPDFRFRLRAGVLYDVDRNISFSMNMSHATIALKHIKNNSEVFIAEYTKQMSEDLKEEQDIVSDMFNAIEKEQFEVYLQPQYDYAAEALTGAEALVRWNHPKRGMIPPNKFIPIFEKNGFITVLDKFVWDKTCKLVRKWIDQGLNPVPVSVNISRRDIYNTNILDYFDQLMKDYQLTPRNLRLEITESAYIENPSQLISVVEQLQQRGFTVEMDDFGSGYSSLNTLKDVPVDVLKLDMKFIMNQQKDQESNSRSGSILSSIVRMANWLHLPVIAEGIESKEQADYLKSIGCFNMQGYYFAKPMPADQYENLLLDLPPVKEEKPSDNSISEAASFLDASTQATLLFNSFVGGAAIIEWTGSNVEAVRMNDLYFEEIGTTREDYKKHQKNILDRLEKNSRSIFLTNLAEATRSGKQTFCEVQCVPLYSHSQPYWLRVRIRHLAKTVTSDIFYIAIDNINFRMNLLELNTNLSEQLSNIMESAPCGIATLTYKTKFKYTFINENFAKMFGYNQNEFRMLLDNNPMGLFKPEVQQKEMDYLKYIIDTKQSNFSSKTYMTCADGHLKRFQINGNIFPKSDGSVNICIVVVDITDKN